MPFGHKLTLHCTVGKTEQISGSISFSLPALHRSRIKHIASTAKTNKRATKWRLRILFFFRKISETLHRKFYNEFMINIHMFDAE